MKPISDTDVINAIVKAADLFVVAYQNDDADVFADLAKLVFERTDPKEVVDAKKAEILISECGIE